MLQFAQAHERMGTAYRKGLEAFKAADHDPQAGDKAVAAMDREPSQLLDQAGDLIAKASAPWPNVPQPPHSAPPPSAWW